MPAFISPSLTLSAIAEEGGRDPADVPAEPPTRIVLKNISPSRLGRFNPSGAPETRRIPIIAR